MQQNTTVATGGTPRQTYGKELCLLSLDGGGVRGLSTLQIIKQLMELIDPENPPKPCDYFDMIGGTSTGGLIALMLGRLGMTVDEAIDAYTQLSPKIFTKLHHKFTLKGKVQGRFDHTAIEEGVKALLVKKGYDKDTLLKESATNTCKTFVCATSQKAVETTVLSSYFSKRRGSTLRNVAKVWEAARATAAATSFFDPIEIGGEHFVDGATPANNPINEMWSEAFDTFKDGDDWRLEDNILCLVSIGTGIPSIKPFGDGLTEIADALLAIATDTEKRAEDFHKHHTMMAKRQQYFRFNVLRGLESVGLEDAEKKEVILSCTRKYLQTESIFNALEECSGRLAEREMLQSIITAAKKYSKYATAEYNRQGTLKEVQEACAPDSDSLAWFTNTHAYQGWQKGWIPLIYYPITPDSASKGHDTIVAALSHHLRTRFASKTERVCNIFYFKPDITNSGNETYPALNYEEMFRSLISQVLMTYGCMEDTLLSVKTSFLADLRKLRLLLTTDQILSLDDLLFLWRGIIEYSLKNTEQESIQPSAILSIDRVGLFDAKSINVLSNIARFGRTVNILISATWESNIKPDGTLGRTIDEDSECNDCLDSLKFQAIFARRDQVAFAESGTNEWIWSYPPYVKWVSQQSSVLWIQGKPGSGKSVLAKTILSRLTSGSTALSRPSWYVTETSSLIVGSWFYSTRHGNVGTSHVSMLRSILYQILDQDRSLFPYFRDVYRKSYWDPEEWESLEEIFVGLSRAGSNLRPTVFIIDAMDESREEMQENTREDAALGALYLFKRIVKSPGSKVKVLVLSRPKRFIEMAFTFCHHIVLENANAGDIEKIVEIGLRSLEKAMSSYDSDEEEDSRGKEQNQLSFNTTKQVSKAAFLPKWGGSLIFGKARELRLKEISSIREYLLSNARGVILWVTLIIKELLRHVEKGLYTIEELRAKLATLPLQLHDMYSQIVENIYTTSSKDDIAKARKIIVWVVGASQTKTLELRELLDALAITDNLEELARASTSENDPLVSNRPQISSWNHFRRSINELCGPFIDVIRAQASTADEIFDDFKVEGHFLVQLIHQTATEFLSTKHARDFRIETSDAKSIVENDKLAYLRVAIPQFPASYLPSLDFKPSVLGEHMIDFAIYLEQKLLLSYVFETLPTPSRDHVLRLVVTKDSPKPLLELLGPYMPISGVELLTAKQTYLVATFFWIACGKGLETAIQNIYFITGPLKGWWLLHRRIVLFAICRVVELYHPEEAFLAGLKIFLDGDVLKEEEEAELTKYILERDIIDSEPEMVLKGLDMFLMFPLSQ